MPAMNSVVTNGMSNTSDQALQDYLDSLLNIESIEPPAEDKLAPVKFAASNIATLPANPRPTRPSTRPYAEPIRTLNLRMPLPPVASPAAVIEEKSIVAEAIAPPIKAEPIAPAPTISPQIESSPPIESIEPEPTLAQMAEPAEWLANGRPYWAQQPFECLLFKSGGLILAAPLVELGSIYPMDEDSLTSLFGQTSWFMGLLPMKEYSARAVDTAMVVMPERYSESMRTAYRFLITLHGSDWGLAVDSVVNSVVLDPSAVRWRGQRSKRPWLAGTVVEQMCALLDISQLAWMFHNQDRKRHNAEPA
jgi:purine-binding chemotaxis protein CheW